MIAQHLYHKITQSGTGEAPDSGHNRIPKLLDQVLELLVFEAAYSLAQQAKHLSALTMAFGEAEGVRT